jgi:hypothetical protein
VRGRTTVHHLPLPLRREEWTGDVLDRITASEEAASRCNGRSNWERLLKSMFFPKETHRFQAAVPVVAGPRILASFRRRKRSSLAMATILRRIVVEPGH